MAYAWCEIESYGTFLTRLSELAQSIFTSLGNNATAEKVADYVKEMQKAYAEINKLSKLEKTESFKAASSLPDSALTLMSMEAFD